MDTSHDDRPAFLRGGGELAGLIAAYDWRKTALGPIEGWPSHVRHTVATMLRARLPMVALFGEPGVMIYNDEYSAFAGGRHPKLLGSPVREGWPEVADFNDHVMRVGLAGGTLSYQDQELTLHRKGEPEQVWMNLDYSPILDDEGKPAAVLAIVVETSRKVRAERRIAQHRAHLHQMFQQAPGFICILEGPDHVFQFSNRAYKSLFGRDVDGKTAREAFPDLVGQGFFELLDDVYRRGEPFRAQALPITVASTPQEAPRQLYLNFVYQPLFDEAGKVAGIFVEGFDVTETVSAYEDLQRTRDWLQEGLQAAQMVAFEWHFDTDRVRYSQNCQQVLGYTDGTPDAGWSSIHPEDRPRLEEAIATARRTFGQYQVVTRRIRPDNRELIWADTRGRVYADGQGEPAYMRGIIIDVSERVRSEQALTEANRRKDEFLAMLAHELRNPLAPIATASEVLARSADKEKVVRHFSDVIRRQVGHMRHLVDDLLDVSRVTRGLIELQQDTVDLKSAVNSAVEQARPLIDARQHELSTLFPAEDVQVLGDRTRLVQILVNLLTNASKYTPPGGRVGISLTHEGGRAQVTVSDSGVGIEPELLPHVFELFAQGQRTPDRAQGGLGIGLALVRALVGLHGGEVQADSAGRGQGSRFTVSLPALASQPLSREQEPWTVDAGIAPLRILVTDDNADAAETLASLLEMDSHSVRVCYDAAQALRAIDEEVPDVCILDVGLPDMTGTELARRLRARPALRDTLLIALTGYGQPHDREATKAAGFDHHEVKPVDVHTLRALLARHSPAERSSRP